MRALLLATARPGTGRAIVDVVAADDRVPRAFPVYGPFDAALELVVEDRTDLRDVLAVVNDVEATTATETLLEMEVEELAEAPAPRHRDGLHALALVDESKAQGCDLAHELFSAARKVADAVDDAYPLLGRFDDAVWLTVRDLAGIEDAVRGIEAIAGVADLRVLVERPGGDRTG